jgi:hypothetical protein
VIAIRVEKGLAPITASGHVIKTASELQPGRACHSVRLRGVVWTPRSHCNLFSHSRLSFLTCPGAWHLDTPAKGHVSFLWRDCSRLGRSWAFGAA